MKKVIAHIITAMELGGAQLSVLRHLIQFSQDTGYSQLLITGPSGSLSPDFRKVENLKIIEIPSLDSSLSPLKDLKSWCCIAKALKKENVDLVHTHSTKPSVFGRSAAFLLKIPFIHTYHGFGHDYFSSFFIKKALLTTEKFLNSRSKMVSFVCQENKHRALKESLISNLSPVIGDFIELEQLRIAARKKQPYSLKPRIGAVISVKKQKNPFILIDLMLLIKKKIQGASFFIAGEGPLLAKVKTYAAEKKADFITFMGPVTDILEFYKDLNMIVSTSSYEGLSMVHLEAMALNIPLLTTKKGGVSEIMQHGKQGYFFNIEKLEEASTLAVKILSGAFRYQQLDDHFWNLYRTDTIKMEWLKSYNKIMNSSS